MKQSMAWVLAVSAVVGLGCGGNPSEGQVVSQVRWSSSTSQCLADQLPVTVNGESTAAACTQLSKAAAQKPLLVTQSGGPDQDARLCCAAVCSCSPSGCDCSDVVCVACAY